MGIRSNNTTIAVPAAFTGNAIGLSETNNFQVDIPHGLSFTPSIAVVTPKNLRACSSNLPAPNQDNSFFLVYTSTAIEVHYTKRVPANSTFDYDWVAIP